MMERDSVSTLQLCMSRGGVGEGVRVGSSVRALLELIQHFCLNESWGGGGRSLHASPPFMIPSVRLGLGFFSARARTVLEMENALHGILTRRLLLQKVPPLVCVCVGRGLFMRKCFSERAVEMVLFHAQEVKSINTCFCLLRQLSGFESRPLPKIQKWAT